MPIYEYQCVACQGRDQRVAGIDDHTAICADCNGLMLRLEAGVFEPYFEAPEAPAGCDGKCRLECEVYSANNAYCREQGV